jgi:3-hydroxyacyl-[acyl-carrier-protein] dehydratase
MDSMHLSLEDLKSLIPHREPFLFVDEVIELVPGKKVTGKKYFSGKEDFFKGHFPGMPILPGVIIVEMAAQISAFMILAIPSMKNLFGLFTGVEKFRFIKKIKPGTSLIVKSKVLSFRHNFARSEAQVFEGDILIAEGVISAMFIDKGSLEANNG